MANGVYAGTYSAIEIAIANFTIVLEVTPISSSPQRSRLQRFVSNFRKAPLELKAFVGFAALATAYAFSIGLLSPSDVREELFSYTSLVTPASYGYALTISSFLVYYRKVRAWHATVGMAVLVALVGGYSFAFIMDAPLAPAGAMVEHLAYQVVCTCVVPVAGIAMIGSPRVYAFCEDSKEKTDT